MTTAWQPIETAPADGEVDVWLKVYASPRSYGWTDAFRVTNAYQKDGKWFHRVESGHEKELFKDYITHWMPVPPAP